MLVHALIRSAPEPVAGRGAAEIRLRSRRQERALQSVQWRSRRADEEAGRRNGRPPAAGSAARALPAELRESGIASDA